MYTVTVVDLYASGAARAALTYHIDKDKITIGRDSANDIVLRQTDVSTKHASIKVTKKGIVLTDLKSTNGTKVNRERLSGSILLSSKDEIQIGGAILQLSGHALLERASSTAGNANLIDHAALDDDEDSAFPSSATPSPAQGRAELFGQDERQREHYNPNPDHGARVPYSHDAGRDRDGGGPSPLSLLVPAEERSDPFRAPSSTPRDLSPSMAFPSISALEKDDRAHTGSSSICEIISDLEARTKGREPAKGGGPESPPVSMPSQPPLRKVFDSGGDKTELVNAILTATFWMAGTGKAHGQTKKFASQSITIGRSPSNALSLPCPKVSTQHARLEHQNQRLVLLDLQSTNGTKINGKALHGQAEVTQDDVVSIGSFDCAFAFQLIESRGPSQNTDVSAPARPSSPPTQSVRPARNPNVEAAAGRFPSIAPSDAVPARRDVPTHPSPSGFGVESQALPVQPEPLAALSAKVPPASTSPQNARMLQPRTGQAPHAPIQTPKRPVVRTEQVPPRDRSPSAKERASLVRQELGAILDQAQDLGVYEKENGEICVCIATALRHLFPIVTNTIAQGEIEKVSHSALVSVREALAASLRTGPLAQFANGLTTALAWLVPLTGIAARNSGGPTDVALTGDTPSSRDVGPQSSIYDTSEKGLVARFVARADFSSLEGVGDVVSSVARSLLFDEIQEPNLRCAVEEACANVVMHAFDYPGQGTFEVSFFTSIDRELVITVDDRGLPHDFSKLESGKIAGMGVAVMRALCPKVQFISRGREGKRVRMSFELPPRHTGVFSGPKLEPDKLFDVSGASRYEVLPLKSDAALEIARCAYRSESYGHSDERIYDVALQERRLGDGTQLSVMAVSEAGHGVGHLAVVRPKPDSRVGCLEELAIVPQLRGSNIMSRLAQGLMQSARDRGMHGLLIATPSTQKFQRVAVRGLGAIPTGYWVVGDAGLPDAGRTPLGLVVTLLSYLPLVQAPEREVFLPPQHAEMLLWSYRALRLDRLFNEPPPRHPSTVPALSVVKRNDNEIPLSTVLQTTTIGEDLLDVLASHQEERSGKSTQGFFVDLPLERPETSLVCERVEQLGFVFSCLLPNTDCGDVLRLQRKLPSPVSFESVEVEDDYETALRRYVDSGHAAR